MKKEPTIPGKPHAGSVSRGQACRKLRRRRSPGLLPVLGLTFAIGACGEDEPPALSVGSVSYSANELLGLTAERREALATIAGLGLAIADSSVEELGAPLVDRRADERLLDLLRADLTVESAGIDGAELERRYGADPDWELTVRHILFFSERFRSPERRRAAEEKAGRALRLLRDGADFAETAAMLSEEPGAEGSQGLLEPGRRGSWVEEFWSAALELEPGEISEVTETRYGYHILRLEAREPLPFADGRSELVESIAAGLGSLAELTLNSPDDTAAALAQAERRELTLPAGARKRLMDEWIADARYWSEALGFTRNLTPEGVAAAALAALGLPAQNAVIARNELQLPQHAALTRMRYATFVAPAF